MEQLFSFLKLQYVCSTKAMGPIEIVPTTEMGGGMNSTTCATVNGPTETIMTWGHVHLS